MEDCQLLCTIDIPSLHPTFNAFLPTLCFLLGVQPLPDIEEVNMFKDDNSVVHFRRPTGKFDCFQISCKILTRLFFLPI